MKSFFSRLNDIQAGPSKPTKESSFKFWIPSNANTERNHPKPTLVHSDVAASHGEKRSHALKSTHAIKTPFHDVPIAPIETHAIHTNNMPRHTTRPNLGSSSTPYSQNHPPPSSRTPRPHEHNDAKYQVPPREPHGPAYPTGVHAFRETSSKSHRGGRHELVAPVPPEIWLPPTKQVEDQNKLHFQGTSGKLERYRESGDDRDRVKEPERQENERDRDRREREWEKGRTREREREERERERIRTKERERTGEKEREKAWAKREQDRNWETDRGKDRDKYTERDRRERERDSDREGEKEKIRKQDRNWEVDRGKDRDKHAERDRREKERDSDREGEKEKIRTKDKGSRKERAWDSDMPYDGERTKQDERSKARHRDRATGGGGKDDNRESRVEKKPERTRERLGRQVKHRAEATDGEQDARLRTLAPDRHRRKDSSMGWASDTHAGHSRKLLLKPSNTLLPRVEEGEGSSSKIVHSHQGMPAELLATTKSSTVKATIVTVSEVVQLPVPPTPQHMPIYLPPKESNAVDSGLPPTIAPLNVVSAREAEAPPRKETVNRLKSSRPDEPLPHAETVSKPREIDTSIVRRPPSRGPAQPQNPIPSYPMMAHLMKGTRESVHIHRPRQPQPSLTTAHDKLQPPGSFPLPEMLYTSTEAEGSKEPNRFLEPLPDSRLKKEVDLVPSVLYQVQYRIPPQSAGTVPSRPPMESTPQTVIPLASTGPAPSLGPDLPRKATHSLLPQGSSSTQIAAETDPSHNLQIRNWDPAMMSGNNLTHEAQPTMGTPAAQVVSGKSEPLIPPSSTVMQRLQSAHLNENIIQDSGQQAVAAVMVSKTNEAEAVTKHQSEVSLLPMKPTEGSYHQLYNEPSINRPSSTMDHRSGSGKGSAVHPYLTGSTFPESQDADTSKSYPLLPGWRNNVNVILPHTLPNQDRFHVATTSSVDVHLNIPPLKSSQSRSDRQESVGIAITRPSTATGFRQNTSGKNLRNHNNIPPDSKIFHAEGFQVTDISFSHSDAQNTIGISIPRPSTATAIKQSSSGHSSRQTFNTTSHKLNPLLEEANSSIFPGPSISRQSSIPVTNLQPITLPIIEEDTGFPTQPHGMTPNHSTGPSFSRGHAIVLPEDVTLPKQDVPGSHRPGHTDDATDPNVTSPPENFTSAPLTTLNQKPDNLRGPATPFATSILTSNDDLVKLHSASMSYRQDSRGISDHVPSVTQNSHQAFKDNSAVLQPVALTSANNDNTGHNIIPTLLNAEASDTQPIILPSGFTAPQNQIRSPLTSPSTRNDSVPSALPSAVIVPQIQIHHLITATSTRNKPEPPHTDFRADASTPCTPAAGAGLEKPDISRLATVDDNGLPIHLDQPQSFLGSGNKYHRSVHLEAPTPTSRTADANDVRPSIDERSLQSQAEDSRFNILRIGSSQEVSTQTFVNNHSATLSSNQPDSASPANQTRQDLVGNPVLNLQMNNGLAPSLGFFNNTFSEILHSPVVRQSGQGEHPATKVDGRNFHDLYPVFAGFESDRDDGTDRAINMKTFESLVNKDATRNVLPKEQPEVPSVEHLTTRKDLHIGIDKDSGPVQTINMKTSESPANKDTARNVLPKEQAEVPSVERLITRKDLHIGIDKDSGTVQLINRKMSGSVVNKDAARNVLPKEQSEVPSVERLIAQKDLRIGIHDSKVTFPQMPSEINRPLKSPSPTSQPRIQHPGLAEILSSPFNKDHNDEKGQLPSSSTSHIQPISTTVFSKSGSSPKFLDKQSPDDKLVPPKSSPSDLRQKEVEQHPHESPKRQLQQTPISTSRSAHLQNLLSNGDPLDLTNVPSLSSHPPSSVPDGTPRPFLEPMPHVYNKKSGQSGTSYPEAPISTGGPSQVEELAYRKIRPPSIVDAKPMGNGPFLEPMPHVYNKKYGPSYPEVPISTGGPSQLEELVSRKTMPPSMVDSKPMGNGPFLEPMAHVYNKKSGQSGASYPEVSISTNGPSQVEELASRKIRPPSMDSKLLGNSISHYRAATPLRESTSTTRHQRSVSQPIYPVPSANVPSADGPLRSTAQPPLHHISTNHSQTKSGYTRPPGSQTLAPNITRAASDSEEILMTPSSLAHSVMLKPTISRQSVTPSMSSQTARKGTGILSIFRSKTPAQPPPQYEIWHPNTSSKSTAPDVASSGAVASSFTFPEQKTSAPIQVPVRSVPIAIESISQESKVFTPFRYLRTRRNRSVSLLSVKAQDGTSPSTVAGSPTTSMLSQAPFQPPPIQDPMQAALKWVRDKEQAAKTYPNGKLGRQPPGVVFDVAEAPPGGDRRQRPKRIRTRHKSPSRPS